MLCHNCGTPLPDNAVFCNECGYRQNVNAAGNQKLLSTRQNITQRFSRRTILLGTAGLATIVVVGGTWAVLAEMQQAPSAPLGTTLLTYRGHTGFVSAVAWSPDGQHIASASSDKTVQVWDAATGARLFTYRGHSTAVLDVAWSPDGTHIASCGENVQIIDATNGKPILTYHGHPGTVSRLAWSADSKRIASGGGFISSSQADPTIHVWDATIGNDVFIYHGHSSSNVTDVKWAPDGSHIASAGNDTTTQVWKADTGETVWLRHDNLSSVGWSPDSTQVVAAGKGSAILDANTGKVTLTPHDLSQWIHAASWSPDGKRLAFGNGQPGVGRYQDAAAQICDATSGNNLFTYRHHTGPVLDVAWSPDSQRLASASSDKTVHVWQAV